MRRVDLTTTTASTIGPNAVMMRTRTGRWRARKGHTPHLVRPCLDSPSPSAHLPPPPTIPIFLMQLLPRPLFFPPLCLHFHRPACPSPVPPLPSSLSLPLFLLFLLLVHPHRCPRLPALLARVLQFWRGAQTNATCRECSGVAARCVGSGYVLHPMQVLH